VFLIHRRDIIEAVKIGKRLQISFELDQLFRATMQKADMRVNAPYNLAIELQPTKRKTPWAAGC